MKDDLLQDAITMLQGAIRGEGDHRTREKLEVVLIKALVTRFARYGWADDLDEGLGLLRKGDLDVKLTLIDQLRISGLRGDHFPAIVSSVLDLLRDYRQSIDKSSLDTAFALAIRAIASCQGVTNTQAQLLLRVGNAFALRYLASGDEGDLGLAGVYFQDAKRAFNKGDPMLSVVLLNLQHIGWMKLMECESRQKPVGFREMERFGKKAQAEDRGGLEPYMLGTALLKNGGRLHLDNAIFQFRRSLSLRPPQHPRRHDTLGNCAIALLKRFILTSNFEDLEESVQMQLQALALRPPNHPDRSRSLDNLANALCTRFNHRGDFRDLEECIARHREALSLQPPGHPDRPASLVGLASALDTRFEHKGNVVDLEESIASHRGALVLLPPGHPERSSSLINFAGCLLTRFKLQGDFRDLEECIACNEEALALMAPGDPERCGPLENVAISLSTRYQYEGNFLDLEESLSLFREVLNLRPPGHSDRPRTLRNLASSLSMRFRHKGDFCDLDECIDAHRKALSHQLPGHPGRGISLSSLGGALSIRFQYRHDLCDLEESVASHSEALALIPPGHQDLSNLLNNLAISLSARFERKGDIHDLKMAIKYHREALTLRPPGCADRPSSLNNLANALAIRFQREGDLSDLEECIVHVRDALTEFSRIGPALALEHEPNLPVVYNPDSLKTLTNLVTFLKLKYKVHSDSSIQDEIFRLLRSGAQFHGSSPLARLDHAGLWSSTCREFCRWENALEAHKHGVDLLPHLASLDLTLEQRQNVLIHAKELSGDAVQCAIEQGELETAVVFLSTARSVFWSQTLQFRGSLDNLEALHPDLASELRSVTGQLEIATGQNLEPDSMSAKLPSRPYLLARKREEVIARIRATDGFHDFLLPPCFDTLKNAARGGPVVFLNASEFGCHALIMKGDGTLLPLSLLADMSLLLYLADAIPLLARGQEIDVHVRCNIDNCFDGRDVRLKAVRRREDYRTADDDFRDVLEILWEVVAQPVITALGLSKTSAPQRIWWCPTGPFAFLPIHAAGISTDAVVIIHNVRLHPTVHYP
ncbi:mucin-like protein 1, variant 3 [Coprinopsis cinerea AmutBmut pab1-1]|nr:mucin-like protein 1, variant 3 [Coprinopsis cinerea AmutBmut pab1-1]